MGKTERSNGMQCSQGFFRGEKPDVLQETRCIAQQTAAPCRATMEALHDLRLDSRTFVRLPLHRPNGANGVSDIEGKVTRAGARMEPRGREQHRWANREVEMRGST